MNMPLKIRKIRDTRVAAAVAVALLLAAPSRPTLAAGEPGGAPRASKSESTGVAGGFAVGAAAGGPIGALLGAAAGGWLGDRMHREQTSHARTRDELARANQRGAGLAMHLMFRTDEARLRPDDEALVAQFAALAAATPGARVFVAGFADPRGAPRYNAALAAERAATVAARLAAAGLPAERLVVSSETAAVASDDPSGAAPTASSPDLDGYAFQRRVTVQLVLPAGGEAQVAQRR
jgi:outer membrane protein OmpA-like peptidoglycan-associated protein